MKPFPMQITELVPIVHREAAELMEFLVHDETNIQDNKSYKVITEVNEINNRLLSHGLMYMSFIKPL